MWAMERDGLHWKSWLANEGWSLVCAGPVRYRPKKLEI
jgi:hypothetical protein